jgi:methyl-accepting chemotaxis protein
MRSPQWASARLFKPAVVVLVSTLAVAFMGLVARGTTAALAQAQPKMEATIFSYDGKDFVRTKTTMVTESGKSAVDTKLDHNSPAYKALLGKQSYVGDATVFGRKYDADYAPLTGGDGRLTGALFIGVAK